MHNFFEPLKKYIISLAITSSFAIATDNEFTQLVNEEVHQTRLVNFTNEEYETALNDAQLIDGSKIPGGIMAANSIFCGPFSGYLAYGVVGKMGFNKPMQYIIAIPCAITAVIRIAYPSQHFGNSLTRHKSNPESTFLEPPIFSKPVMCLGKFGEFVLGSIASVPVYYLSDNFFSNFMGHLNSMPLNSLAVVGGGCMCAGLIEMYIQRIPLLIDSIYEREFFRKYLDKRKELILKLNSVENYLLNAEDTKISEIEDKFNQDQMNNFEKIKYLLSIDMTHSKQNLCCDLPTASGIGGALMGGFAATFNYNLGFESTRQLENLLGINDYYNILPAAVGAVRVVANTGLNLISCYDVFKQTAKSLVNLPTWAFSKEFFTPYRLASTAVSLTTLLISVSTATPQVELSMEYPTSNNTVMNIMNPVSNFIANYGVCYWSLSNLFYLYFGKTLPKETNHTEIQTRMGLLNIVKTNKELIYNLKSDYVNTFHMKTLGENSTNF